MATTAGAVNDNAVPDSAANEQKEHSMTHSTPADICIISGRVFDGRMRTALTAVAITGDRITAVGTDAQIRALAGEQTRIVDAAGEKVEKYKATHFVIR